MSAEFTPGPWKTGNCDSFIVWAPRFRSVEWIACEPGPEAVHIGDAACPGWALRPEIEAKMSFADVMNREAWIEECKANARLMAGAPELYEALELALELIGERGSLTSTTGMIRSRGRAALAKARGDQ